MSYTVLLYSSHNRCEIIHHDFIVSRALQSPDNKTILFLPMSVPAYHQQSSWESFRWYFDRFRSSGLQPMVFYWSEQLNQSDVDLLFRYLLEFEVVVLGGGSSSFGMNCYQELGRKFYNNPNRFREILIERQKANKLTVGFSAGAAQLGEYLAYSTYHDGRDILGFGLAKNIVVTAHHELGREGELTTLAKKLPQCLVFGLPNDSGILIEQGKLPSHYTWQILQIILDYSWDVVQDAWHIKTRHGMRLDHYYCDGRHWAFNNGDMLLRVLSEDCKYQKAWIAQDGKVREYWSQEITEYANVQQVLEEHKNA